MDRQRFLDGRLKIRHLVLVIAIAENGSLLGAAKDLHVTQPAVTRALRETESIVGVELFVRGPRGVRPTASGDILLDHARAVVSTMTSAQHRIDGLLRDGAEPVRVGTNLAGAYVLLPSALVRLKAEHPTLTATVIEGLGADLDVRLAHGEVDLLVGRPPAVASRFHHAPLYEEPVGLVARRDHPAIRCGLRSLAELQEFPWILPGRPTALRDELDELFARHEVPLPRNVIECSTILTMRSILLHTDAITPLPLLIGAADDALGYLPVRLETVPRAIGITTLAGRTPSKSAQLLIGHLVAEAQRISAEISRLDFG
ncbi:MULTISPECIES: LysR substrate-binding domain-containing protein [unclassified Amycolatopsis]|uniref:LysR substrate-binding domain-containing protein n=1 Tax=unclassified Amycolatopsis TaxID=2618356 RepID=UPI001C69B8E3|nr:LysR substrate-binding domain-containing protein [Amycolatopsis sp. DSM 110486]QYN21372.1 LysR family transcriptional regulator [Amycolatopsis sp. DSM 110486]